MLAQLCDRLGRAGDRLSGHVEDTVDVDENGGHARRVYSDRVAPPRESGHRPREDKTVAAGFRVTRSVTLPANEIELRFSRSSGPGGQHAQRSETRVEAFGIQGRIGLAAVRPLISTFQNLVASDGIDAALRIAEDRKEKGGGALGR